MDRHLRVKHMQISGSATLFYIVKGREKNKYGTPFKNHIIRTLLNGMSTHLTDEVMTQWLTKLWNTEIIWILHSLSDNDAQRVFDAVPVPDSKRRGECHEFDSQAIERLLTLTLPIFFLIAIRVRTIGENPPAWCVWFGARGLCTENSNLSVEFAGMSSRWPTEIVFGRFGGYWGKAIIKCALYKIVLLTGIFLLLQTMLTLINDRLTRNVFDDVMEVAWSTMWNVTDETAVNCERFLDGQGMDFFLWSLRVIIMMQINWRIIITNCHAFIGCLQSFPEKDELLRNMMGLLGNVAEVKRLRSRLMTSEFIKVFSNLLESCRDGIEVIKKKTLTNSQMKT